MFNLLFKRNWKTTIAGLVTGGALGYAGYSTGNYELMVAGFSAFTTGVLAKDAEVKEAIKG